jgi:hypothetical protein
MVTSRIQPWKNISGTPAPPSNARISSVARTAPSAPPVLVATVAKAAITPVNANATKTSVTASSTGSPPRTPKNGSMNSTRWAPRTTIAATKHANALPTTTDSRRIGATASRVSVPLLRSPTSDSPNPVTHPTSAHAAACG